MCPRGYPKLLDGLFHGKSNITMDDLGTILRNLQRNDHPPIFVCQIEGWLSVLSGMTMTHTSCESCVKAHGRCYPCRCLTKRVRISMFGKSSQQILPYQIPYYVVVLHGLVCTSGTLYLLVHDNVPSENNYHVSCISQFQTYPTIILSPMKSHEITFFCSFLTLPPGSRMSPVPSPIVTSWG